MVIIDEVAGDLLNAKEPYIAQQCNCVTVKPHGLSQSIAKKWSYGDAYSGRSKKSNNTATDPDEPGSVVIAEPPEGCSGPILLQMMAQWCPSKPGAYNRYYPTTYVDSKENRRKWFKDCLQALDETLDPDSVVAMPDHIGCGLAGGNWTEYKKMLSDCSTKIKLYKI